jgi:pyrroline-5-carboxylate reductase
MQRSVEYLGILNQEPIENGLTIHMRTLGIIGGRGWIGQGLVSCILDRNFVAPRSIIVSGRSSPPANRLPWPDVEYTDDNASLVDRSDVVILSVRPQQFSDVLVNASRTLLISVMAGVSVQSISLYTGATRIVRAMPNAALELRQSFTPWFAAPGVQAADKEWVQAIFACCGTAEEVASEAHLDYLTGLTGSGPAFIALLAESMLSHAVANGLPQDFSLRAVRGLIGGASRLVAEGNAQPADILDAMMGYRGTTAAALIAMTAQGFTTAVQAGLAAAEATARGQLVSGKLS